MYGLNGEPREIRFKHVDGKSMTPTINDGVIVLVDIGGADRSLVAITL